MSRPGLTTLLVVAAWSWVQASQATGDAAAGRELAIKYCARCHVIADYNPLGGIGSTPSFQGMTFLPDYEQRLRTFYARRPHPVFARVPDYPRWSGAKAYVQEFTITVSEIEDIVEFVITLAPEG
jgi:mono/diheme cytochrome c family protein